MIEIIPDWHPVFVHFTIGLLITATLLFLVGVLRAQRPIARPLTIAARVNLWIGAGAAIATVIAGLEACYTVAQDAPAHVAMTSHLKWAWATLACFLLAAVIAWRERQRAAGASLGLTALLLAGSISLGVTSSLGAENVYRHGLGVMRLPAAEAPGHHHEHGSGATGDESADDEHGRTEHHAGQEVISLAPALVPPAEVVDAFHHALSTGDLTAAQALLDPEVQVFESGEIEGSAAEYAAHHLPADAAFLSTAHVTPMSRRGDATADLAWLASESRISVEGSDPRALVSIETMILRRTAQGWRIAHIHWSSRPAADP
jgi:uncharacterized membrane protein